MTATDAGPCAALVAAGDPGFLGFLAAWEHDREPPPPLADYLRDRGHDRAADAVEWLCRRARNPKLQDHAPVMPALLDWDPVVWGWYSPMVKRPDGYIAGDEFPGLRDGLSDWVAYPTFGAAVAAALDRGVDEEYR